MEEARKPEQPTLAKPEAAPAKNPTPGRAAMGGAWLSIEPLETRVAPNVAWGE